ncbi:hypothetical protein KAR10_09915 [bacterium]|nr:hypothetical protein [bacterium]
MKENDIKINQEFKDLVAQRRDLKVKLEQNEDEIHKKVRDLILTKTKNLQIEGCLVSSGLLKIIFRDSHSLCIAVEDCELEYT